MLWLLSLLAPRCAPGHKSGHTCPSCPSPNTTSVMFSAHSKNKQIFTELSCCDREPLLRELWNVSIALANGGWRGGGLFWWNIPSEVARRKNPSTGHLWRGEGTWQYASKHPKWWVAKHTSSCWQKPVPGAVGRQLRKLCQDTCLAPFLEPLEPLTLFSADWFLCAASKMVINCRY